MSGEDFVRSISALLVVAPHPDDEILGCGWLMRAVARAGGQVVVAWLTDGGGSHGALSGAARAALVARRQEEARSGLAALDVVAEAEYHLGARDGHLAAQAATLSADRWLQDLCVRHTIDTVAVTAGDDGHPDHRVAFTLGRALAGVRLYAYPVSARYDGTAVAASGQPLRLGPFADEAKGNALRCHTSQSERGGASYPLRAEAIARFCGEAELFIPASA